MSTGLQLRQADAMKHCHLCDSMKPLAEFPKNKRAKSGRYAYCTPCNNNKARRWRKQNPDHWTEYHAANRDAINMRKREQRSRGCARTRTLHERHKITLEDYESMLAAQNGECAICLARIDEPLQVDHDHASGKIRGLLCGPCNRAIGLLGDDAERVVRAAFYLLRNYQITVHLEEEMR